MSRTVWGDTGPTQVTRQPDPCVVQLTAARVGLKDTEVQRARAAANQQHHFEQQQHPSICITFSTANIMAIIFMILS